MKLFSAIRKGWTAARHELRAAAPERYYPRPGTAASGSAHDLGWLLPPVPPEQARQVLWSAMTGELESQWELFCLMEDGWDRLAKNLNEVKNAVRRLDWTVTPYSERGAEATDSAQEKADLVERALRDWRPRLGTLERGFEDTVYDLLDAFGKGLSVVEVHWEQRDGVWLPRATHQLTPRQYAWNGDRTEIGLRGALTPGPSPRWERGDSAWTRFDSRQFLVGQWTARSGPPVATALLRSLVPYYLGAAYGWRWLMDTAEMFGVPFRWATYDASQPGLADTLMEMLSNLGAAGYAAFPIGTTIDFKEAVTNAEGNPQSLVMDLARKACDLLILGQEMSASAQGGEGIGSGKADLQGRVRDEVLHHAAWWVAGILRGQLVPALIELNFGEATELPTIAPDTSLDPDPKAQAERDQILVALGLPLPMKWLYDRHQVPQPDPDDEVLGGKSAVEAPGAGSPSPRPSPPGGGDGSAAADDGGRPAIDSPMIAVAGNGNGRWHPRPMHLEVSPLLASADPMLPETAQEIVTAAVAESIGARRRWLEPVQEQIDRLVQAAMSGEVSDADLARFAEECAREMPDLFARMDIGALAESINRALGAATVAGVETS
jgi:phage gp29-like protein